MTNVDHAVDLVSLGSILSSIASPFSFSAWVAFLMERNPRITYYTLERYHPHAQFIIGASSIDKFRAFIMFCRARGATCPARDTRYFAYDTIYRDSFSLQCISVYTLHRTRILKSWTDHGLRQSHQARWIQKRKVKNRL